MFERSYRMLPNGIYCCFAIISAIYELISKYPQHCKVLLDLFEVEGVDANKMCVSNWACKNAETLKFHQEIDSSYTMLSVPFWNKEELIHDGLKIGTASFIFKCVTNYCDQNVMYLPIKMDEGISIYFSGYGCYHRQHRTGDRHEFWNLASYQNRSFWYKLCKSIQRCVTDLR